MPPTGAPAGQGAPGEGEVYQGPGQGQQDQVQSGGPGPGAGQVAWPDDIRQMGIENPEQLRALASRASMYEAQQELIQNLMQVNKEWANGAPAAGQAGQQAPAGPRPFIGPGGVFPSTQAYIAAYQADPNSVEMARVQWANQVGGAGQRGADPALAGEVRQIKQSLQQQSWNQALYGMTQRYPHLQDPAVQKQVDPFIGKNMEWARSVQEYRPDVPMAEILVKAGDYDRVCQELAALKGRMGEVRQTAGVARTSVGGATQPLAPARTQQEAIQRVAAEWRAKHGMEPPGLANLLSVVGRTG